MSRVLTLASASPRRKQLLEMLGIPVRVQPSHIEEIPRPGESPACYAERLAREKAESVAGDFVLGADTTVILNDSQIREALAEPVRMIVQAVRDGLERIPPELSADVYDRGIVLSGGGALLQRLDDRLRRETGLPVSVAEDPLSSVVLGAGKMLSDFALLRKVSID